MKKVASFSDTEDRYTVIMDFTKDDLEDILIMLHGVDGYYLPYGSSTDILFHQLLRTVEELLVGDTNNGSKV